MGLGGFPSLPSSMEKHWNYKHSPQSSDFAVGSEDFSSGSQAHLLSHLPSSWYLLYIYTYKLLGSPDWFWPYCVAEGDLELRTLLPPPPVLGWQAYTSTPAMVILSFCRFTFNYVYGGLEGCAHECRCRRAPPPRISSPGTEVTGTERPLMPVMRTEFRSLQEQYVLLTSEPPLQPLSILLFILFSNYLLPDVFPLLSGTSGFDTYHPHLLTSPSSFSLCIPSWEGPSILSCSFWIHLSLFSHSTYTLNSQIQPLCLSSSITSSYIRIPVSN